MFSSRSSQPPPGRLCADRDDVAGAVFGLYSLAITLGASRLLFGVGIAPQHHVAFAIATVCAIISLGSLGFLMATSFIFLRTALVVQNLLEYPLWLLCGMLGNLSQLPTFIRAVGYCLSPTWSLIALRSAAEGSATHSFAADGAALGLALISVLVGIVSLRVRAARPAQCRPRARMRSVRKALVAGLISYRGLFGWISPGMYVATLIGSAIFQMLAFVFAGRDWAGSDAFFVIGNAVLACSLSTINGAVQLVANDRAAGTL